MENDIWITIPRGQNKNIKPLIELQPVITAPVEKSSVQGSVKLMLEDEVVATSPLIALDDIKEGGLITRITDEIRLFFSNK